MFSNCWINSQLCPYYTCPAKCHKLNKCMQHNISHDRHINTSNFYVLLGIPGLEKGILIIIITILSLAAVGFKCNIYVMAKLICVLCNYFYLFCPSSGLLCSNIKAINNKAKARHARNIN